MTTGSDEIERLAAQRRLVDALRNSAAFGHGVRDCVVIETHISYVLLAGDYAFKIKKAVDFEFLDFTTLQARRYYCAEEVRLNRPLAPAIYLDVVAITGSIEAPSLNGDGPALEFAVRMRRFDQDALLSRLIAHNSLGREHVDALARTVAGFHRTTARAPASAPFGSPSAVLQPALQNFAQILEVATDRPDRRELERLREWTVREHVRCTPLIEHRRHGFIRECHGDLHLNNIALIDAQVTLFDRVEFNESLRWTDVMSDVAFLVMDLRERGRPDLAARFLNAYLEMTGDFEGLEVLPFYTAYRAMVRAKIASLRMNQGPSGRERDALANEYRRYIGLVRAHGHGRPAIVVMHGLAGSGKSTVSEALVELTGGIRVRTDVERKRLHGLQSSERSDSPVAQGLYSKAETDRVYRHVCGVVRGIAKAGFVAIADGTFLKRWQRDLFRDAAESIGVPFVIVACAAPLPLLRERVERRAAKGDDASEATLAVLETQLMDQEGIIETEEAAVVRHSTTVSSTPNATATIVKDMLEAAYAESDPT